MTLNMSFFPFYIEILLYEEVVGIMFLSLRFIGLNKLMYTYNSKNQLDILPDFLVYINDVFYNYCFHPYRMYTYTCVYYMDICI